jgi:hypothetical protein
MVLFSLYALLLAAAPAGPQSGAVPLPAGTLLDLMLVTPIHDKMPEQDIMLKVARDVKVQGHVAVPKGAAVTARLTLLRKASAFVHNVPRAYFIVGLQLVTIEIEGNAVPVSGSLEIVGPATRQEDYFVPYSRDPNKWGALEEYRFSFKVPQPRPGESFLGVVREGLSLPKDLRLVFRTVETA